MNCRALGHLGDHPGQVRFTSPALEQGLAQRKAYLAYHNFLSSLPVSYGQGGALVLL